MRITICDVCDEKFDSDAEMIEMVIPADFLGNVDGIALHVDICGWPCANQIVDGALNTPEPEPEEQEEKAPTKPFIMVPKSPMIDTDMDPAEMARYTEAVTGVKRRT